MLTAGEIRSELAEKINKVESSQELRQAYHNVLEHLDEYYPGAKDEIDPETGDPKLLALLDTMLKTEPLAVSVEIKGNVIDPSRPGSEHDPKVKARKEFGQAMFGEMQQADVMKPAHDLRMLINKLQQDVRPPFNLEAFNIKFEQAIANKKQAVEDFENELNRLPENASSITKDRLLKDIAVTKREIAYLNLTREMDVEREKIKAEEGGDSAKLKALAEKRDKCKGFLATMNEKNKTSLINEGFDKEKLKTFWDAETNVELNGGQRMFSASNVNNENVAPAQKSEGEKRSRLGQLMSRLKRDKTEPAPEPDEKKGHRLSWSKRK